MQEHGGVRAAVELCDDRIRKALVHRHVSVEPRVPEGHIDVGLVGQAPHVVMQEPERRIRDDVVVALEGSRVVGDEPEAVGRAVPPRLVERLAAVLLGDEPVLLAQRAGNPCDVVLHDEPA